MWRLEDNDVFLGLFLPQFFRQCFLVNLELSDLVSGPQVPACLLMPQVVITELATSGFYTNARIQTQVFNLAQKALYLRHLLAPNISEIRLHNLSYIAQPLKDTK